MTNMIKTVKGTTKKQILFATQPYMAIGAVVGNSTIDAGSDGKKIIKAGTPLTGDLTKRTTAFTKTATDNVVGVLLHDLDVTAGDTNGTVLIFGFVDLDKLESDVESQITETIKTALKGKITFLK